MVSHPDHIGAGQDSLHFDSLTVDEGPIGAAVHQDVALRSRHDLGVAARDILVGHDDIAAGLATKHHRCRADGVLSTVGQANESPAGSRGGRFRGTRLELPGHLGHIARADELSAAAAAGIGHQ
jgi:hypothetical protein